MPHDVLAHDALAGGLDGLPLPRVSLYFQLRDDTDEHEWTVRSFVLDERLHEPYALTVTATGPLPTAGVEGLLEARMVFELTRGEDARTVHGVVFERRSPVHKALAAVPRVSRVVEVSREKALAVVEGDAAVEALIAAAGCAGRHQGRDRTLLT